MLRYDHVLVAGDFNIHVYCKSGSVGKDFFARVDSFNLTQWMRDPNHKKGHTRSVAVIWSGL